MEFFIVIRGQKKGYSAEQVVEAFYPPPLQAVYAFDTKLKEPVCSEVFPGNNLHAAAVSSFLSMNRIEKGMLVADNGYWRCNTLPSIFSLMVKPGLAVDPEEKRKPGRAEKEKSIEDQRKRKRGRPPKNKVQE